MNSTTFSQAAVSSFFEGIRWGLSLDGKRWIHAKQNYLLPCKILSQVFRGKYLDYLEKSFCKLKFNDDVADLAQPAAFKRLLVEAARKQWIVYAKEPFAGPEQVLEYLGNYTHRIAISNYRIEAIEDTHVTFRYKDRTDNNKSKLMRVKGQEFCRRFLNHVLPEKFVRIRHFGLLGSRQKNKNIETARKILCAQPSAEPIGLENYKELLARVVGVDIDQCGSCKTGKMKIVETLLPHRLLRRSRSDTS